MFIVTKTLLTRTNIYLSKVTDQQGKTEYFSTELVVDNPHNYSNIYKEFTLIDDAIDFALNG